MMRRSAASSSLARHFGFGRSSLPTAESAMGTSNVGRPSATLSVSGMTRVQTLLEHNCSLGDFFASSAEKTGSVPFCAPKLVATIGPSCMDEATLQHFFYKAGLDIARINCSHGTLSKRLETIRAIRKCNPQCVIAIDTKGPEVRTGAFCPKAMDEENLTTRKGEAKKMRYFVGDTVTVFSDPGSHGQAISTKSRLYIDYPKLTQSVLPGVNRILVADGTLELLVKKINPGSWDSAFPEIECEVQSSAELTGRNNVHLPGINVDLPALSTPDKEDITQMLQHGADMVFASFIRTKEHIETLRAVVKDAGITPVSSVPIIAKIENRQGLVNIQEIVDSSDGIMVARGDLGVEIPTEKVFLAQKMMISKCNLAAKPVIVATQMLESMTNNQRPTRAEASDVANAIVDGADCVMLSGETANGKYPIPSLDTLRRIALEGHSYIRHRKRYQEVLATAPLGVDAAVPSKTTRQDMKNHATVASAAVLSAYELEAKLLVTTTISARSVRLLAKHNPPCPILAVCRTRSAYAKLKLVRGVVPVEVAELLKHKELLQKDWSDQDKADLEAQYLKGWTSESGHQSRTELECVWPKLQKIEGGQQQQRVPLPVPEWVQGFDYWVDLALQAVREGLLSEPAQGALSKELLAEVNGSTVVVTCTDEGPHRTRGFTMIRSF